MTNPYCPQCESDVFVDRTKHKDYYCHFCDHAFDEPNNTLYLH